MLPVILINVIGVAMVGLTLLAKHEQRRHELQAATADLHTSNAAAITALDTALANIAAREAEWPASEARAIREGLALAAEILRRH